jgi:hypothetical protein
MIKLATGGKVHKGKSAVRGYWRKQLLEKYPDLHFDL